MPEHKEANTKFQRTRNTAPLNSTFGSRKMRQHNHYEHADDAPETQPAKQPAAGVPKHPNRLVSSCHVFLPVPSPAEPNQALDAIGEDAEASLPSVGHERRTV